MQPLTDIPKSDPAPSRWAYRLERLMLTPLFRKVLRFGVPFCAAFIAGTICLSDKDRQEALTLAVVDLRQQIETRPEFMINLLAVEGASEATEAHLRSVFPYEFPLSSFDVELAHVQTLIEEMPAVASANVRVRQGGVLVAEITERVPVALWKTRRGIGVVDIEGVVIGAVAHRAAWPGLPIIAGPGADHSVGEALEILRAATPLGARVTGLVRMGERRWDVVLDREQRILLPEQNPVRALERVLVLNQAKDLLARDLAVVDMRLSDRPTVRMTKTAQEEWWRVIKSSAEASEQ